MVGFRLNWPETTPGRIQTATGIQSANLAVNGYGSDQSYMRLAAELPRYRKPVAVVALFSPTLVERNLGPVTLRERAASLNGRLAVESGSRGSRVEITLPR